MNLDDWLSRHRALYENREDRADAAENLALLPDIEPLPDYRETAGESGMEEPITTGQGDPEPEEMAEWPERERLAYEKETVGFFLTGHPLEHIMTDLRRITDTDLAGLADCRDGQLVRIGGLIASYKEHKSKKGERMAFTVLEDMSASVEVIVFPSTFAECAGLLQGDRPLIVLGLVQQEERGAKIVAQEISLLDKALEQYTERAIITLRDASTSRQHMQELKELFYQHHGSVPVLVTLRFDGRGEVDIPVHKDMGIRPGSAFFHAVTQHCGPGSLEVRMKKPDPPARGGRNRGKGAEGPAKTSPRGQTA